MWYELIKKYYMMGLYTESDLDLFKKAFEEENIDGSYNSIDSIEEIKEDM